MLKILYIGRFELPDKEATANRVVANAKLLRDIGYEVELAGWSDAVVASQKWVECKYFDFKCYEKHKSESSYEKYKMFSDAAPELALLKKGHYNILIAYDFPAVALKKLMKYCKQNDIKCICDVSEWYTNSNKNPLFRLIRAYDSYLRMNVLHKKADGLFVISKYLQNYYSGQKIVLLPPLVDCADKKWDVSHIDKSKHPKIELIYAGWPSKTKECLNLVVSEASRLSDTVALNIYGIDEAKYRSIYAYYDILSENVVFHGRVSHTETVEAVKNADYSIIVRESCRKNNAGFPSKLVESISCGTPVLVTDISNVRDYIGNGKNGFIISVENLEQGVKNAILNITDVNVCTKQFDYRNFTENVAKFINEVINDA